MIRLRKLEPTDLPYLYQWENDAQAWACADTHNPLSQQDLKNYIESTTGDIYKDGQLRLIIEDEQHVTLGCVDLYDFDPRNRKAAIGIYIAPNYRQQGYAQMAIQEIEQYAFGFLHLRMLYALTPTHHARSMHVFCSLSYREVAVLPNWTLEGDVQLWIKTNI